MVVAQPGAVPPRGHEARFVRFCRTSDRPPGRCLNLQRAPSGADFLSRSGGPRVVLTAASIAGTMSLMARSVAVVVTDDLDGSPDAETVTFALDGVTYEIDLGADNRARLDRDFAPYIEAGRRISRSRNRSSQGRPAGPRIDRAAVRAWAKENGIHVSERGRISADLMSQYEAAH